MNTASETFFFFFVLSWYFTNVLFLSLDNKTKAESRKYQKRKLNVDEKLMDQSMS